MNLAIDKAGRLEAGRLQRSTLAFLHRSRARLRLARSESKAALEDFRRAIQLSPSAPDHVECGRILHGQKRLEEALLDYDSALKHDPRCSAAWLGRAETLFEQNDPKEAVRSLDCYLKHPDPAAGAKTLAGVYRARAVARSRLGSYTEAIDDFTLALSLHDDSSTRSSRGWAYLVHKAPHLALADFSKAIGLDDNNADAYNGRGTARILLGGGLVEYREAVADAENALRRGAKTDRRIAWQAARIYARAEAALDSGASRSSKIREHYRVRALQLLRQALELTPPVEREAFRRKSIQADPDLARFAGALRSG
jgi:tetratricopeptide (TPR) repeat protein